MTQEKNSTKTSTGLLLSYLTCGWLGHSAEEEPATTTELPKTPLLLSSTQPYSRVVRNPLKIICNQHIFYVREEKHETEPTHEELIRALIKKAQ